jgi:katanin p60 ATPase-containing subunit A1
VPPVFVGHGSDKELVEMIHRDIMDASPNIHWEDIAKLEDAKRLLQGRMALRDEQRIEKND